MSFGVQAQVWRPSKPSASSSSPVSRGSRPGHEIAGVGPDRGDRGAGRRDVVVVAEERRAQSRRAPPSSGCCRAALTCGLGPGRAAVGRARDEGVHEITGVGAARRDAGREVGRVGRVAARVLEDHRQSSAGGGDVGEELVSAGGRVDRDRRAAPREPVRRVAAKIFAWPAVVTRAPDHVHAAGVGRHRGQAREAGVGQPAVARERPVATGVRAEVGRVERNDRATVAAG